MEESTIWIIAVVAMLGGALMGYLIGRSGSGSQKQMELVDQLEETKREFAAYKQQVSDNFEETAHLVGNLTESYRNVHQHLAKSSAALCENERVTDILATAINPTIEHQAENVAALEQKEQETKANEESPVEQPRDYAPKGSDQEGTLSETFGLKGEQKPEEPVVADAVDTPSRRSSDA
ncbi:MAG: YhcB family protein [Pontibacterium sp.]